MLGSIHKVIVPDLFSVAAIFVSTIAHALFLLGTEEKANCWVDLQIWLKMPGNFKK